MTEPENEPNQSDNPTVRLLDTLFAIPANIPGIAYRRLEDEYNRDYAKRLVTQYGRYIEHTGGGTALLPFVEDILNELAGEWCG